MYGTAAAAKSFAESRKRQNESNGEKNLDKKIDYHPVITKILFFFSATAVPRENTPLNEWEMEMAIGVCLFFFSFVHFWNE